MTVCPWCSSVVDDDATIVARGDHVYHARCYDHYSHAKKFARTDLLPPIDMSPVAQNVTKPHFGYDLMNEADKATAPSSAASEFGPASQTPRDQIRDRINAQHAGENAKHFGAAGADLADCNACAQCNKAIPRTEEFWWDGLPYCNNTCRIAKTDPEAAKRHAAERANLQGSALPLPAGLAKPIQAADDPRHKQHGTFAERAEVARALKRIIELKCEKNIHTLQADQMQALDEICGKISRICCGDPNDPEHWDDIAGYAELVADRLKGVVR